MIVALQEVPRRERHLLYCSRLLPRRPARRRRRTRSAAPPSNQFPTTDTHPADEQSMIPTAASVDTPGMAVDAA
jgi:hypothetical protein